MLEILNALSMQVVGELATFVTDFFAFGIAVNYGSSSQIVVVIGYRISAAMREDVQSLKAEDFFARFTCVKGVRPNSNDTQSSKLLPIEQKHPDRPEIAIALDVHGDFRTNQTPALAEDVIGVFPFVKLDVGSAALLQGAGDSGSNDFDSYLWIL